MEYYSYSGTFKDLGPYVESDAKRNFTTNLEMIRRIIRKHYGLPEFPGRTLYPKSEIDTEINRRIQDIVQARIGRKRRPKGELGIRKMILKTTLPIFKATRNDSKKSRCRN